MIKKNRILMVLLLAAFVLFSTAFAQEKSSLPEKLNQTIPKLLETNKTQGVAVGVIEDGKTILLRGYGKANVKANRSMTADTIINVASISKPVTTWGILHLVEKEKLNLDAPINSLLKNWTLPKSEFDNNQVTFKRLLSHTAGTSVVAVPWFSIDSKLPTLLDVLNGTAGEKGAVKVEKEPGKTWSYSGGGYAILQFWIEEQTHQTLHNYMQTEVCKPLGMKSTTYPANLQTSILYDENGNPIAPYQVIAEPAGGLNTTARVFVQFKIGKASCR
ncbi:MAG TPA: serine hydrolase domain-containing protein, partial [Pyrinomonadaceae bacterium]|nr:serine hydrolase domain-containing protein [Pyrinomonadaceae bacterium]